VVGWEAVALRNDLDERGFLVRDIPVGEPVVRISVGCFLQEEELDSLASCIRELIQQGQ
jgi:histidinol-phosphate/aromatic aminotransferase/cobyric acid decarboxylase-like protein